MRIPMKTIKGHAIWRDRNGINHILDTKFTLIGSHWNQALFHYYLFKLAHESLERMQLLEDKSVAETDFYEIMQKIIDSNLLWHETQEELMEYQLQQIFNGEDVYRNYPTRKKKDKVK